MNDVAGLNNARYLGEHVADLTAQNFANTQGWLAAGVFYWNTTVPEYRYYDGAVWHGFGGITTASKSVFVDAVGTPGVDCDFTTIAAACAFLKALPGERGGVVSLRGGQNHNVSSAVDARGVTFQSVGGRPTIVAVTGGSMRVSGSAYRGVAVSVPLTFAGTFLFDADETGSMDFLGCTLTPAAGKAIIGNSGPPIVLTVTFRESGQSLQDGMVIDPASVFAVENYVFLNTSLIGPFQMGTKNVIVNPQARYIITTGVITSIPADTIYVSPGENIQAALDSVAAQGGAVYILPGIHVVQRSVNVFGSNVLLKGYGASSVIRAYSALDPTYPWLDGETLDDAVINYGTTDGLSPVNNTNVETLALQVEPNIHGIQCNGGVGNKASDNIVASSALKTTGRTAVLFTDSVVSPGERFTVRGNSVTTYDIATGLENSALRYTDGMHVDGAASFPGQTFGYGNGIVDSLVTQNQVRHVGETGYIFDTVRQSSIFVNRGRDVCFNAFGIGLALINCSYVEVELNSLYGNRNALGEAVYAQGTSYAKILTNTVDGGAIAFVRGIYFNGNSDNNQAQFNSITMTTTGIRVDAGCDNNRITPNLYGPGVATYVTDSAGVSFYMGIDRTGTGNPNGVVTGMFGDCFFDTVTSTMYKCTSKPRGSVWQVI